MQKVVVLEMRMEEVRSGDHTKYAEFWPFNENKLNPLKLTV